MLLTVISLASSLLHHVMSTTLVTRFRRENPGMCFPARNIMVYSFLPNAGEVVYLFADSLRKNNRFQYQYRGFGCTAEYNKFSYS